MKFLSILLLGFLPLTLKAQNNISVDELGYMMMELLTSDYNKMDSIAEERGFKWNSSEQAYFNNSGTSLLMFSFNNRKLEAFIATGNVSTKNYYRNELINRGFKGTKKSEDGVTMEVFPINFGGSWVIHDDPANSRYGIQLISVNFKDGFFDPTNNMRIHK